MEIFVPVARVGEIAPGKMKAAEVSGRAMLVANAGGTHFVCVRSCPHEGADMLEGELAERQVICNNHGYRFDLATGTCLLPKGECPDLSTLPVVEKDGEVCVKIEW